MTRIALAAFWHETNTFAASRTGSAEFAHRWYEGRMLHDHFAGSRTVIGGALAAAAELGAETIPVFGAFATPSGRVEREVFERASDLIVDGLAGAGPIDGVLLELHGALVVDGLEDGESELARRIRAAVGEVPLGIVLDFHANAGRDRLRDAEIVVGYKTNPHVDTFEQGARAMRLVVEAARGARWVRVHRGSGILAAPIDQGDATVLENGPVGALIARAAELEREHGLADVTVHGGFAFTDAPHRGLGVSATGRPDQTALLASTADELLQLAERLFAVAERSCTPLERVPDAVAAFAGTGLVAVSDTGDNINGGGDGTSTALLSLLRAPGRRVLGSLCSPAAAAAAGEVGVGGTVVVEIGHEAVPFDVVRIGPGRFVSRGPMASGVVLDPGATAVLEADGLVVLASERALQPNDPELFRSQGVEPTDFDVVALKGAAALRAGWTPLVAGFVDAETPGATDSDLERLFASERSTQ